jgi:hypothetical protein
MIQASTPLTSLVFESEAKALLPVADLARRLNIHRPTYLKDNQTLAKVAASRRIDHPLLQWNTRNTMASFFNIISSQPSDLPYQERS